MTILINLFLFLFVSACSSLDPLNEYAMQGQVEEMRKYLDRYPESVNKVNPELDYNPLEYSIMFININRNVETFKLLLERGARFDNIRLRHGKPTSAMEMVAEKHNIEAMEALIKQGETRRSPQAFHNALGCDNTEHYKIITGATHADTEYLSDQMGVIKWMLDNGWSVDQKLDNGTTPLMTAFANCSLEIVEYLIEKGANLNDQLDLGFDILYFAVRSNKSDKLNYLLKRGFKPKEKKYGKAQFDLLHVLLSNDDAYNKKAEGEVIKMIEILVNEGVNINSKHSISLYTPLTYAAFHGSPAFLTKLIELGAQVNPLTSKGETPLDVSVKPPIASYQKDVERILMNAGGVYKRYGPQQAVVAQNDNDDSEFWGVLGGLGASVVGFQSGLSEAASIDVGVRMAKNIKEDNVTIDNFKAKQALMPKNASANVTNTQQQKVTPTNSKMKVANQDFNVDKNARSQFAGTYANTHFDKGVADYRYVLNTDGSVKLYTRVCENCTHDLQGQSMSRDWKESYQALEWAPMLDDQNKPLLVQVKDMFDKSYQARILLVILQGGKTMTLKHYTDNKGQALHGSYGVALYKN